MAEKRTQRRLAAQTVDAARVLHVLREMAEGKNNAAIAETLVLTERSVEKVIHSIFLKLGLRWEAAVHKRVKAVVLYLGKAASVTVGRVASPRCGLRLRPLPGA